MLRKRYILAIVILSVTTFLSISAQQNYDIPAWVKDVAGFWAEDKISDQEFGEGLTFLIDNDILKVPKIKELQEQNLELRKQIDGLNVENSKLKNQLESSVTPKPTPTPVPKLPTESKISSQSNKNTIIKDVTCKDVGKDVVVKGKVIIGDSAYSMISINVGVMNSKGEAITTSSIPILADIEPHETWLFESYPLNYDGVYEKCIASLGLTLVSPFPDTRYDDLTISGFTCKESSIITTAGGTLTNNGKNSYSMVQLSLKLYDSAGNVLGSGLPGIFDLAQGDTKVIDGFASYDGPFSKCEMYVWYADKN